MRMGLLGSVRVTVDAENLSSHRVSILGHCVRKLREDPSTRKSTARRLKVHALNSRDLRGFIFHSVWCGLGLQREIPPATGENLHPHPPPIIIVFYAQCIAIIWAGCLSLREGIASELVIGGYGCRCCCGC